MKQPTISDFEKKAKGGTYGDYIKTSAARTEADSQIRKYINQTLKELKGAKLVKFQTGKLGTLDYGRAVLMFAIPPSEVIKELNTMRNRKDKDQYWVIKADFGRMARSFGTVHFPIKSYKPRLHAEKKYAEEVRYFLKG